MPVQQSGVIFLSRPDAELKINACTLKTFHPGSFDATNIQISFLIKHLEINSLETPHYDWSESPQGCF